MLSRLYRLAVFGLLLAALLPGYARAVVFGYVLNVQAWVSIALLLLLGAHFLLRRGKSVYLLYLIALFAAGALVGWRNGASPAAIVSHAFIFTPLLIAFLLLELDLGGPFEPTLFWLTVCGAAGAIAANVIHVFRPDLLATLLKEEDDVDVIINLGRVAWAGYVITLLVVAQLGFMDIHPPGRRRVAFAGILVVLVGALLTFNRTLVVALVVMLAYLLWVRRRTLGLKGVAWLGGILAAGSAFITWWGSVNPGLVDLINLRILSFFSGSLDVTLDVSIRQTLYGQYLDRLKHSFLLGQGLGVPVSTFTGDAVWADVSLVTVAVPFGIFGLALFALFLLRLRARIRTRIEDPRVRRLFLLIFFLGLAISLNDDIWTHKFFVVYLVYAVNSWGRAPGARRRGALAEPITAWAGGPG